MSSVWNMYSFLQALTLYKNLIPAVCILLLSWNAVCQFLQLQRRRKLWKFLCIFTCINSRCSVNCVTYWNVCMFLLLSYSYLFQLLHTIITCPHVLSFCSKLHASSFSLFNNSYIMFHSLDVLWVTYRGQKLRNVLNICGCLQCSNLAQLAQKLVFWTVHLRRRFQQTYKHTTKKHTTIMMILWQFQM